MLHNLSSYGIIILAAGASTRLGQPKQLLVHQGKTLLQTAIDTAAGAIHQKPIVVTGAYADKLLRETDPASTLTVYNELWEEGMASSIRCGIRALMNGAPHTQAVVFMVCDQPFVTVALIQALINKYEQAGKKIVASTYSNTMGIPALFDRSFFDALLALKGREGAKKIIMQHAGEVTAVDFEKGGIDIDTPEDAGFLQ